VRRQLLLSIMGTVLAVIVAFGTPLAIAGARLAREEADRRLQRDADAVALAVESGSGAGGAPADHGPAPAPLVAATTRILLVSSDGRVTQVSGPAAPKGAQLVAESPTDRGVVVRLETPSAPTDQRVHRIWYLLGAAAIGALLVSLALATVLSRRLSRPLRDLADVSSRLGAGDFRARASRSGIPEMDAVAVRLNATTEQLARMVERERHFSANASHQLRTALTALRIPLEELTFADDPDQIQKLTDLIVHQADRLQATIEDLLALARGHAATPQVFDVAEVVAERAAVWKPVLARHGRRLASSGPAGVFARGSPAKLGQVLDILIDNADRHGAGDVNISIDVMAGSPIVRVSDDGAGIVAGHEAQVFDRGMSLRDGRGIGLAVARDLLREDEGRLVLARARPPIFEVFLARAALTEA
jgi:signal transduction histidine kinase